MNPQKLFVASCMALVVTAMSFAIRGDIMGALEGEFSLSKEQMGWVASTAFWGFTVSMVVGGPLCDVIGMGRLVTLAFLGHLVGITLTIFANGFGTLFAGTLAIGLANGFVEAACNPLIATVYPTEKTKKLNHFHVWFPGGIVIGGLVAFALTEISIKADWTRHATWQIKMAMMLVPLAIYGLMFLGQKFPRTERAASGISAGDMFMECARPLFLLMMVAMLLTASTELGTGQWITNILQNTLNLAGSAILVLVWINGLMAIGRQFAGPVVHRLSPTGMLLFSSIFAAIGLLWLSTATTTFVAFAAATVFAVGVCYFWPTMLGFVAERLPKTGAMGLAAMGGAGMLSVSFVLPLMGKVYDEQTAAAIPPGAVVEQLKAAAPDSPEGKQWTAAQAAGGAMALRYVVVLPLALILIFGALYLRDRMAGGYKVVKMGAATVGGASPGGASSGDAARGGALTGDASVRCPSCGQPNPSTGQLCRSCGADLPVGAHRS